MLNSREKYYSGIDKIGRGYYNIEWNGKVVGVLAYSYEDAIYLLKKKDREEKKEKENS